MSIKNMEKEKPYIRRENYFQNNSDINNYFPIIYTNCPKTYYK